MTALKKRAKKKSSKAKKSARLKVMRIKSDGTFTPDPLNLKPGDLLKIVGPGTDDVDITVSIDVSGGGGGGGPVVIHS